MTEIIWQQSIKYLLSILSQRKLTSLCSQAHFSSALNQQKKKSMGNYRNFSQILDQGGHLFLLLSLVKAGYMTTIVVKDAG